MNESVNGDTFDKFKVELDQLGRAEDIGKSAPGTLNLLQVACEMGLPKHLEAMLKIEGTQVKTNSPKRVVTIFILRPFLAIFWTAPLVSFTQLRLY